MLPIENIIRTAFPAVDGPDALSDEFISANESLLEIEGAVDLFGYAPMYMLWCIRNKERYDQLVTNYTIDALAVWGRTKEACPQWANFKFLCNPEQKQAVTAFLLWCQQTLNALDNQQLERAIKRWKAS